MTTQPPPPSGEPVSVSALTVDRGQTTGALPWLALVFSVLCGPVGLVLGIVGLARWKRSGNLARGLSIIAVVVAVSTTLTGALLARGSLTAGQAAQIASTTSPSPVSAAEDHLQTVSAFLATAAGRRMVWVPASHQLSIDGQGWSVDPAVTVVQSADGSICASEGGLVVTSADPSIHSGSCPA